MREWTETAAPGRADRAAFAEVVKHFAPRVREFLLRAGASEGAVEDATRDVMLELWQEAAIPDPFGPVTARRVFTLARARRATLLGTPAEAHRLDPARAFAPAAYSDAPMPSLAAVEARLRRIQDQLRRTRNRQARERAA